MSKFNRSFRVLSAVSIVSTACVISLVPACLTNQQAKAAIDVATAICIVANADLPDERVMIACNIEEALAPVVKELLAKQRAQLAKARAGACMPDAGAPMFDGGFSFRFSDAAAK